MQVQRPLATITPTLDGDVLAVLVGTDVAFTPGQVARMVPSASVEGIRKVLKRLAEQGIVTVDRVGNAYTYRLNRDHLAAPAVLQLANQRATLLTRIEDTLAGWQAQPVYAAVFGSAARGQMRVDSAVDIFLVRSEDADSVVWESLTADLAEAVTRWTGNDTRVLDMTEAEVHHGATTEDPVLHSVAAEGLTVAGSPRWLRSLLRDRR